jgi:hypothetical protein
VLLLGAAGKGSDLLIRFFESEWFDAFIALTWVLPPAAAAAAAAARGTSACRCSSAPLGPSQHSTHLPCLALACLALPAGTCTRATPRG